MRYKGFFLVILFTLLTSPLFAYTTEYQLITPENKTDLNFSKNSYNEIGTLKITASEKFDTNKNVIVTVQHDGKFTNSNNSSQTINYNLVLGTSDSYKILNSGDKIEFSATSIDAQVGVTIGAVITGDASDGDYKTEIKFSSVSLPAVGSSYTFGKYDGGYVIWRFLGVDSTNKRALLVTKNCVTKMTYQETWSSVAWSKSDIKTWLNGTGGNKFFRNANFGTNEKSQILSVKIEDGDNSDSSTIIVDETEDADKIFLLSKTDANKYFNDDNDRIATLKGSKVDWWLRSPGNLDRCVDFVYFDGHFPPNGGGVDASLGVRPALWLKLTTENEKNSTTTLNFTKKTESNNNNDDNNSGSNETTAPVNIITEDLKNLTEEELKEKFENTSNVILYGDLSNADGQDVADLIEKIENVTELKTLDLSNVTGLTEILLPEDTKLQELNVKNSSTLIKIDVSNSPLTKLNTNGCVNLEILNCSSCGIIELEINGCNKISELDCSYNSLTRLNLSGFENLDILKCDHQNINGVKIGEKFNFIDFLFRIDPKIFSAAENSLSELNYIKDFQAFDDDGRIIFFNLNENTGEISFEKAPAAIKYNYQTNFENILMDVNAAAAELKGNKNSENTDTNSGGGSCSSWGGVTFFAALGFLRYSRRKLKN